jgi:hypothetical protein
MTTAWTELQGIVAALSKRQREAYHERVDSWTKMLQEVLPDEALLFLATAVANRTHPDGRRLRAIVARFRGPESPRAA